MFVINDKTTITSNRILYSGPLLNLNMTRTWSRGLSVEVKVIFLTQIRCTLQQEHDLEAQLIR